MKHWGKITSCLFAMLLAFGSLQAQAATKAQDREFNHMSTGFPLVGVHATTACESCHVGGVFVGTPRACDGCHAVGKRVVATPKSVKHIVTDAPCETCHFNTSTFFGARFNHGTAMPGQCDNCHNGRISTGKPSNHPVTIYSCDNCHRTSAWIPASWNHRDTTSDCSVCHQAAGPGRNYNVATHLPMSMGPAIFTGNCKACHTNYYTFLSAFYNHSGAGTACQNCHGSGGAAVAGPATYTGVRAAGTVGLQSVHAAIGTGSFTAATCQSCHRSIATFLGARYDHVGAGTGCATCHVSPASNYSGYLQLMTPTTTAGNIHSAAATVGIITGTGATTAGCDTCHSMSNFSAWTGRYSHTGAAFTPNCGTCHGATAPAPIRKIPTNHTNAFTANLVTVAAQTNCSICHASFSTWTQMNHSTTALTMTGGCKACHDSGLNPGSYFANMEKKSNGHKGYNNATQDCISCHTNQYSRWNHP